MNEYPESNYKVVPEYFKKIYKEEKSNLEKDIDKMRSRDHDNLIYR